MLPIHPRPVPDARDARPPSPHSSPALPGPAGLPARPPALEAAAPSAQVRTPPLSLFPSPSPRSLQGPPRPGDGRPRAPLSRPGMPRSLPPSLRLRLRRGAGRPPSRAAGPLPRSSASATRGDRPTDRPTTCAAAQSRSHRAPARPGAEPQQAAHSYHSLTHSLTCPRLSPSFSADPTRPPPGAGTRRASRPGRLRRRRAGGGNFSWPRRRTHGRSAPARPLSPAPKGRPTRARRGNGPQLDSVAASISAHPGPGERGRRRGV